MGILFQLCIGIMRAFAWLIGSTYEEANTYVFIYLQPLLLVLSSLLILFVLTKKILRNVSFIRFLLFGASIVWFIGHLLVAYLVWRHYLPFTAHNACLQSYKDLAYLGQLTGLGYVGINLFIFIVFFVFVLGINLAAAKVLSKNLNENGQL